MAGTGEPDDTPRCSLLRQLPAIGELHQTAGPQRDAPVALAGQDRPSILLATAKPAASLAGRRCAPDLVKAILAIERMAHVHSVDFVGAPIGSRRARGAAGVWNGGRTL